MQKSSVLSERGWSEDHLQIHIFAWFSRKYPEYHGLLFHVPNETKGGKEGKKKQFMGVVPGVADMLCFIDTPLALELKKPDGTNNQSPAQKKWQKAWEKKGNRYILANDSEAIKNILMLEVQRAEWHENQMSL